MGRLFLIFFSLCFSIICTVSFFYLNTMINTGMLKVLEGQQQIKQGEIALARGKARLAQGERELASGKGTYRQMKNSPILAVAASMPVTWVAVGVMGTQVVGKKIAEGNKQVSSGRARVKAGEAQLAAGKERLENGIKQLYYAKLVRNLCGIAGLLFAILFFILVYVWRGSLISWRTQ